PKVGEVWMGGSAGDPVLALLMRIGRAAPGRQIPLVKQLAVLNQIERERKDLASSSEAVALIARQTAENKEAELEVVLDLGMSEPQLNTFFSQIAKLDALPVSPAKVAAIRSFQSAFEVLRLAAINSSLAQTRVSELTDRLLKLDPTAIEYGPLLVSFIKNDLLNTEFALTGAQLDEKVIELLVAGAPLSLPAAKLGDNKKENPNNNLQLDAAVARRDDTRRFLSQQKYTSFVAVADALNALEELRKNPASGEELNKLKSAVAAFVEPEREPEPKKKKPKHPVVQEPLLREIVSGLTLPVSPGAINDVRARLAPFVGEGLLGYVYAVNADSSNNVTVSTDLIRRHDFASNPWANPLIEAGGRIAGSTARLSQALARLESRSALYSSNSAFAEAILGSAKLTGRRWVTRRAEEYVARSMDLGEEVVANSVQSDQTAISVMKGLDYLMSSRRANEIRALVDRNEITKSLQALTPSELYVLGQSYFKQRLAKSTTAELAMEPGPLGALAKIVGTSENNSNGGVGSLAREARQFGMPTTLRTGLARLDLIDPEPYEHCLTFTDEDRMAQRLQDIKLSTIRRVHRLGGSATLPLDQTLTREMLNWTFAQMRKAASGAPAPGRDWLSIIRAIESAKDVDTNLIDQMSRLGYARAVPGKKWNDTLTAAPSSAPNQ
ncbi:MAG TPA: hypothetical protein VJS64_04790, partial [Pyrinomonadaceae bacterium]|nr:hypothetical protein [Pyrinomonadaceae bacterium]